MEPKLNRLLNDAKALYDLYFHTADFDVFSFFLRLQGIATNGSECSSFLMEMNNICISLKMKRSELNIFPAFL